MKIRAIAAVLLLTTILIWLVGVWPASSGPETLPPRSEPEKLSEPSALLSGSPTADGRDSVRSEASEVETRGTSQLHGTLVLRTPKGDVVPPDGKLLLVPRGLISLERSETDALLVSSGLYGNTESGRDDSEPAIAGGHVVPVRDGQWVTDQPKGDLVAASFRAAGRRYDVREGMLISKEAAVAMVVVERSVGISLDVVDAETGLGVTTADVYSVNSAPPNKRVLMWVRPSVEKEPISSAVNSPPGYAEQLAELASVPVRLERSLYARRFWVGAEGYQWKQIEIPVQCREKTVRLRRAGELSVTVDLADWNPGSVEFRMVRDGEAIAREDCRSRTATYHYQGVGDGDYRITLKSRAAGVMCLIGDQLVTVRAGEITEARIAATARSDFLDAYLRLVLSGLDGALDEHSRVAVRISPRFAGASEISRTSSISLSSFEQSGNRFILERRRVQSGSYLISLTPHGLVYSCEIDSAEEKTVRIEIPGEARIRVRLVNEPGRESLKEGLFLRWKMKTIPPASPVEPFYSNGTSVSLSMTSPSWKLSSYAGVFDFSVVDDRGLIVAAAKDVLISPGSNIVEVNRAKSPPRQIRVTVGGLFPERGYSALGSRTLRLRLADGSELFPVEIRGSADGDLTRSVVATFLAGKKDQWPDTEYSVFLGSSNLQVQQENWLHDQAVLDLRCEASDQDK